MCGIFGCIDKNVSKSVLKNMASTMKFRGPDHSNFYKYNSLNMGYVRLSIIDLKQGNQPFLSDDESIIVFQNGEIYNYRELTQELREKGYVFKSSCDTEVILNGYIEWGIDKLLEKVDGMFTISILDKNIDTLFLCRDRFGEKPLFYTSKGDSFAYSSNLKSLKNCTWIDFNISPKALQYYLFLHYVPWESTIFEDIYKLLPGHYLKYDLSQNIFGIKKYYQLPISCKENLDTSKLENILDTEFSKRSYADVPVGVFLSGGLDSSLLTYFLTKHNSQVNTFSIGFQQSNADESKYSSYIASQLKTNHHHFMFTEELFSSLLDEVAFYLDEPIGDQALLPTYFLSTQAKKYVKVVLSGEGGDEIFGGYSYYNHFLTNAVSFNKFIFNPHKTTPSGFPLLSSEHIINAICSIKDLKPISMEQEFLELSNLITENFTKALYMDMSSWLPDNLLVKLDRMTMGASIEGRAPYLAKNIVEYGFSLKGSEKVDLRHTKKPLQLIGSNYLPDFITYRPKQGFVLPMQQWLFNYLKNINIPEYIWELQIPYINTDALSIFLAENYLNRIPDTRFIFSLLMFCKWYENFIKG